MLKKLIKLHIAPLLKTAGFRKKGNVWNRNSNGFIQVIDFQSDRKSVDGTESFTINMGIFVGKIWEILWNKDILGFVKEVDCYPRFRFGRLITGFESKRRDQWWKLEAEECIEKIGIEIFSLIEKRCLPYFETIESLQGIIDTSIKINPSMPLEIISHGILLKLNGDEVAGVRLIDSLITDPHWGRRAQEVSERLI